ncbi:MAG: GDSL-type esterase/lipase family protein [Puniceicoccaceae bacterium]
MKPISQAPNLSPVLRLMAALFTGSLMLHASAQDALRFEEEINAFREADAQQPTQEGSLLFVGSSSIRMWQTLEQAFPGHATINRGFGGSHFSDALHWFDDLVPPHRPAAIFVYEGDNDTASGKEPKHIVQEAEQFLAKIREVHPTVPVVFISPKPSLKRWHLKAEYEATNTALLVLTHQHPNVYFADVWTASLGFDGKPIPETFLDDELHMNDLGYIIWRNVLHDVMRTMQVHGLL